jgi:uncharacterized protein (TIGR03066 family)
MFVLVIVTAACGPAFADGDKIKIKRFFSPGQYELRMSQHQEGTTTAKGNAQASVSDSKYTWLLSVAKPDDQGEKKVSMRLEKLQLTENSNGKQMSFDSAAADDNQDPDAVFVFRPLMDAQVQMTLDSDDTVVDVSGLDKYWADMEQKANTRAQKILVFQARLDISDKSLEMIYRRHEAIMPRGDAMSVGDTWKSGARIEMPLIGEIKARYDCKLAESSNADKAIIESTGHYETTNPKETSLQGMQVTVNSMKVAEQATLAVDLKTGLVSSDQTEQNISASMTVKGPNAQTNVTTESKSKGETSFARYEAGGNPPGAAPAPGNPFGGGDAGVNPLAPASSGGWAGDFKNEKLSMSLKADGDKYSGTITMAQQQYPFTGTATGNKMQGTFKSGTDSFDFTATLDGDTLTFSTAGTNYTLKRAGNAGTPAAPENPFAADPGAAAGDAIDPAKLLGSWQIKQGSKSTTLTFQSDGNFAEKDEAPEEQNAVTGTYKLKGKSLTLTKPTIDMNDPTKRGEATVSIVIESVDDKQLVVNGLDSSTKEDQTLTRVGN